VSAVKHAKGEYLLFLNPDVALRSDILSLLFPLFKDTTIGVAGPMITNPDGSVQPSVRAFPTLTSQLLILLKAHHISKNIPVLKHYFAKGFNYKKEQDVDQVMGAAFLTTRAVWDAVGGFDTRFFIWFEEVDYCYQVKKLGYRVVYSPKASIVHKGAESFSQINVIRKQFWFLRSIVTYFIKNGI